MADDRRYLHCKHTLREHIEALGASADEISARTGIPSDAMNRILENERSIPTNQELVLLSMALDLFPEDFISWAPVEDFEERVWGRALDEKPVQVTVCGAGNLGHVFVGMLSAREDVEVKWLTSSKKRADMLVDTMAERGGVLVQTPDGDIQGSPVEVSCDPSQVIPGAEVVILCLPSFREPVVLEQIVEHLDEDTRLVSIPATGGINWTARAILDQRGRDDVELIGLIAIPWMCKTQEQGARVKVLGAKVIEGAALMRGDDMHDLERIAHLIRIPTLWLGNFHVIILNPGNQILHPGILFGLFENWDGTPLPEPPLFYENLSERSAEIVGALDDEMGQIKDALRSLDPDLDLAGAMPIQLALMIVYGDKISDPKSLRSSIATNSAYAGIRCPMVEVEGGYAPDWSSRFLSEDLPYGLMVLKGMARILDLETPTVDLMIRWCQEKVDLVYLDEDGHFGPAAERSGAPQANGFDTVAALTKLAAR